MLAFVIVLAAAQPAPAEPTPDQRKAVLAGMTFLECGEMMAAQPTRAAFTAEVRRLALSSGAGVDFTTSGVHLDDDDGHGCRVSFTAPSAAADPVVAAMRKFASDNAAVIVAPAPGGETVTAALVDSRP